MLFRKKGKLRKESDQKLIALIQELKDDWMKHKKLVEQSVEPTAELLYHHDIAQAKYLLTISEAKVRKISIGKMK